MVQPTFPVTLNSPVSATVKRPKVSRSSEEKAEEEVLVVEGIEYDRDLLIKFDVFINATEDDGVKPGSSEFAGSFVSVPHKHKHSDKEAEDYAAAGISDALEDIAAEDDPRLAGELTPARARRGSLLAWASSTCASSPTSFFFFSLPTQEKKQKITRGTGRGRATCASNRETGDTRS